MSHVVIIESLEDHEPRTGQILADFIDALDERAACGVGVWYAKCEHRGQLLAQLAELTAAATNEGARPILHIECHGDETTGLELANGSQISWTELAHALSALNQATGFNLLVVVSACYGGHLLSELNCGTPAPCLALIGPTDEVSPSDIVAGFMRFYRSLFSTLSATVAVKELRAIPMTRGAWFVEHAESWYETIAVGYVEAHCNRVATRARALEIHRQLVAVGRNVPMRALKQGLQRSNREDLIGKMFDTYFMLDSLPANLPRFRPVRHRIEVALEALRRTGKYAV